MAIWMAIKLLFSFQTIKGFCWEILITKVICFPSNWQKLDLRTNKSRLLIVSGLSKTWNIFPELFELWLLFFTYVFPHKYVQFSFVHRLWFTFYNQPLFLKLFETVKPVFDSLNKQVLDHSIFLIILTRPHILNIVELKTISCESKSGWMTLVPEKSALWKN